MESQNPSLYPPRCHQLQGAYSFLTINLTPNLLLRMPLGAVNGIALIIRPQPTPGAFKQRINSLVLSTRWGQGKIVLCVASSGIASTLLPGGQTSHSCFGTQWMWMRLPIAGYLRVGLK